MQLPRVNFGAVQNDVAPATARVAGAVGGFSETMQAGLGAIGHEIVKTQTQDAALKLTEGLDGLTTKLRTQKAVPISELKAELGPDFEQLDEGIRNQPFVPAMDDKGQPIRDPENPGMTVLQPGDVPTFQVADILFQRRAKKLLEDASQQITVGDGWRSSFKRAALADVIAKGSALNQAMLQQAGEHVANRTADNALRAAYRGDFNLANAITDGSLRTLGAEGQAKLRVSITGLQQKKPVDDALLQFRTDPSSPLAKTALEDAAKRLADDHQSGFLKPDERATLANHVHAALEQANKVGATRQAASLALQLVRENTDATRKVNAEGAYAALDAKFQPGGVLAEKPELWKETRSILRDSLADQTEARKQGLNDLAGQAIGEFMAIGSDGTPRMSFANLDPRTLAGLKTYGKDGEEVVAQLVKWDQANDLHERQRKSLPTEQESAKALAIEYALATREKEIAAMGPAAFSKLLLGGGDETLGIPAGAVSSRDVPHLSQLFSTAAKPEKRQYLLKPETVAFEEAMEAFPSLKTAVQKKGEAKGKVAVSEDVRKAVGLLSDRIAKFIDAHPGTDGRGPPQDDIRKEARRLLQTVEVRQPFMTIPLVGWKVGTSTNQVPRIQAEAADPNMVDVPEGVGVPGAVPAPALGPQSARSHDTRPPPPKGTPAGWVLFRNEKTGELRYNAPDKAKGDWKVAR